MANQNALTPEKHKQQIDSFVAVRPKYVVYADALKRTLEHACQVSFPEALVQARAKTVSSFAEKIARKFDKYPDAVHQMTDLCGARVIVQTAEQVRAVRGFIEANFEILESDDKGLLLSMDEFGYRDMHYIARLRTERASGLGFTPEEQAAIRDKCAEVQVRTWLQHAWADTLHDRMYKNKLKLSAEVRRTGALLAALMEEGDRNFNRLADDLDGLIANYTTTATQAEVEGEIAIQELILANEGEAKKKPGLALKLARLYLALGDYPRTVELLAPHAGAPSAIQCELLLELGHALCRLHRSQPASAEYGQGVRYLEQAVGLCTCQQVRHVPHLRKLESLHARALARLGWALEPIRGMAHKARECYQLAYEHEPGNPYYLAGMLGFEIYCTHQAALPAAMRTTIREAVRTACQHAADGVELPYAYFTAGRLSLLLDTSEEALGFYALGIRHCLEGRYCVPVDVIGAQIEWVERLHFGVEVPAGAQNVLDLLALGNGLASGSLVGTARPALQSPILIVVGGAASMEPSQLERVRGILKDALEQFQGTVISGGTTSGTPGCLGEVAAELDAAGEKNFKLVGYLPSKLPDGVTSHPGYDERISIGEGFGPEQIILNWSDILASGVKPKDVLVVGFGGGKLAAVEYRIALGLGASVGIVAGTGGTAETLQHDPLCCNLPTLYLLPFDSATLRAFVIPPDHAFEKPVLEEMAKSFHQQFVANSPGRLPENMRPWEKLKDTFKTANLEQAHYSVEILKAAGFAAHPAGAAAAVFEGFTEEEIDLMARLEHGRWNVERLRNGWRFSAQRNDSRKLHDCLVPWEQLSPEIKRYDENAVRKFPEILAKAGLEVVRRERRSQAGGQT